MCTVARFDSAQGTPCFDELRESLHSECTTLPSIVASQPVIECVS